MGELTLAQLNKLRDFNAAGDRYGYWKYLSSIGDRYGDLALGVVTSETLSGTIANKFIEQRGLPNNPQVRWSLGVQLMELDLSSSRSVCKRVQ